MVRLFSRSLVPLFAVVAASAYAQQTPDSVISPLIERDMANNGIQAESVAVMQGNHILYAKAYGHRSAGGPAIDTLTQFEIGPISTAFTAMAVMELVDQHKVSLDAPAGNYLSDLPKAWKRITVRQLLANRSGIPTLKAGGRAEWDEVLDQGELTPAATPGTAEHFNALNFEIAGKLIEQVSHESYAQFVTDNIFTPLGIKRAGPRPMDDNMASAAEGAKGVRPYVADYQAPADGLYASLNAMAGWEQAMYAGKLLTRSSYQEMFKVENANIPARRSKFTLGWEVRDDRGDKVVSRIGDSHGYSSAAIIDLTAGDSVILMRSGTSKDLNALAKQIFDDAFTGPFVHIAKRAKKGKGRRRRPWF